MGDTDAVVGEILAGYDAITVVGASADPAKAANRVPALMQAHGWRIVPVNPRGGLILGERAHRTLADALAVGQPPGLVDVFRPSAQAADVARQAVAVGATALWLQLGIVSGEARAIAEAAGLLFVENRCLSIERRRLGLDAPGPGRGPGPAGGRSR
jgi:predicted CoA-binding protein